MVRLVQSIDLPIIKRVEINISLHKFSCFLMQSVNQLIIVIKLDLIIDLSYDGNC